MRYVMAVVLFAFCLVANAAESVAESKGVVEKAQCALSAAEDTTGKAVIGGGAGALAGGLIGAAAGGKSGAGWGGLLGGAAGAMLGSNSGRKSYFCRLLVRSDFGLNAVETVSETRYRVGDQVFLFKDTEGKIFLF